MKKSFATISVLVYFAFTCGVMVNTHYCMNSLDSVRFYAAQSDYCTKCGMHTKTHGCCHDEVTIVKLNADQQTSHFVFSLNQLSPLTPVYTTFNSTDFYNDNHLFYYTTHSPPLLTGEDIYLQNCVFRI